MLRHTLMAVLALAGCWVHHSLAAGPDSRAGNGAQPEGIDAAVADDAPASTMELDQLQVSPLPWLTEDLMRPAGSYYQAVVPDTLDLAERAREAVHGLSAFLDDQHHHAGFGHGVFAVTPPGFIHDGGQDQNWGKVLEALVLARAMCGSREHLDRQRALCQALLSYAELKRFEPYPVPLARILMAVEALHRYAPHEELHTRIARFRADLTGKIQVDTELTQGYFWPARRSLETRRAEHGAGGVRSQPERVHRRQRAAGSGTGRCAARCATRRSLSPAAAQRFA